MTQESQGAPRWIYALGMGSLLLGILFWNLRPVASASGSGSALAAESASIPPAAVDGAPVERGDLHITVQATGRLRPWREVELATESGGRILERLVREGQSVVEGEALLRLDDRLAQIELAEAEAEMVKTQAQFALFVATDTPPLPTGQRNQDLEAAQAAYGKARQLAQEGLISGAQLEAVRQRLQVAEMLAGEHRGAVQAATIGLTQAEQRVARAQLALDQTVVRAPFPGRIADIAVEEGQQLTAGAFCFRLLDESRMRADVDVLETDLPTLRLGSAVEVQIPALKDRVWGGRVDTINPRIDEDSGTALARVLLDNPGGTLMAGQLAFVRLEVDHLRDRLRVPAQAVLLRQEREVVFRIEDGRALWTYVTLGARTEEWIEVVEGLQQGDVVAVDGHFALAHEAIIELRLPDKKRETS